MDNGAHLFLLVEHLDQSIIGPIQIPTLDYLLQMGLALFSSWLVLIQIHK